MTTYIIEIRTIANLDDTHFYGAKRLSVIKAGRIGFYEYATTKPFDEVYPWFALALEEQDPEYQIIRCRPAEEADFLF